MATNSIKWASFSDAGKQAMHIVPVINPEGDIQYVRINPHLTSTIVSAIYEENQFGQVRLRGVELKMGLEGVGWRFVADDYAENDMSVVWPHFQEWMKSTPMMGAKVPPKPFPAKYAPPGCAERKAGLAHHQTEALEISIPEFDQRPAHTSKAKRQRAGVE